MNVVIPLASSLVSFVFAIAVLDQYFARRQPYQLVWALGLLMYGIATGCEFLTGAFGLNATTFRVWYLFGAVFAAAFLGLGTVYLLAPRPLAHLLMAGLLLASVYAAAMVFAAPVNLGVLVPGGVMSGEAFVAGAASPRGLTPFFNIFGTVALWGGATWTGLVFLLKRKERHRAVSNFLIAHGAVFTALGGTLARFGWPDGLYVAELAGIIVIFIGFLRSREIFGLPRFPLVHGFRRVPEA